MRTGFCIGRTCRLGQCVRKRIFRRGGMLAKSVTEAARFIAERGVIEEGAPVLVRFIAQVASRFGVVVTQKVAAQTVPVVGALGGAAVNYAFIEHFQEVARGHFTVRRLDESTARTLSGPNMSAWRSTANRCLALIVALGLQRTWRFRFVMTAFDCMSGHQPPPNVVNFEQTSTGMGEILEANGKGGEAMAWIVHLSAMRYLNRWTFK